MSNSKGTIIVEIKIVNKIFLPKNCNLEKAKAANIEVITSPIVDDRVMMTELIKYWSKGAMVRAVS